MCLEYFNLKELSINDNIDLLEMLQEIGPGENGFLNRKYDMNSEYFKQFLNENVKRSKCVEFSKNIFPETLYWFYSNNEPVGVGKLRENINLDLNNVCGHISYCIRPSKRGRGYGNILLEELVKEARRKFIPKILIVCNKDNIPSRKIIEKNNGVLSKIKKKECFYWIKLSKGYGIREMHYDDFDEVSKIWSKSKSIVLNELDNRENICKFIKKNKNLSFCFDDNYKIIGTILCGQDGRCGYIYHVVVNKKYRNFGIGRKLVEKSINSLKKINIDKCYIFVFDDNKVGNNFCSAADWMKIDNLNMYSKELYI